MRFVLLVLLLAACPRPLPTPPPPPPLPEGISPCQEEAAVRSEDVCTGLFTDDGLACVYCKNVHQCVDVSVQIYCVVDTCINDARCKPESFRNEREVTRAVPAVH